MLNFYSLYSGSTGNSLLVESGETKILIDTGVSAKKVVDGLSSIGTSIEEIDAILITHEHTDHVQALGTLSKKYHIPVYANPKTWDAMPTQRDKVDQAYQKKFQTNESFSIKDLTLFPFAIPHDASDPCGFNLFDGKEKLSIATDIGHMTTDILTHLEGSKFLMLESNYDPEVLKCSSYPFLLKTRIAGPNGHLSNPIAGKTIAHLIPTGLEKVMLGHLSKENNFPELAYTTVMEELTLKQYSQKDIELSVASRIQPSPKVEVSSFIMGGVKQYA